MSPQVKPFLRWIGGKRRLASHLRRFVPSLENKAMYWEPFVGAASMYLSVQPKRAALGDINPDLISCYRRIVERPDLIGRYLNVWTGPFTASRYMEIRDKFNKAKDGYHKSALFIILNKTCFNGIWRVSKSGKFNVPYGGRSLPDLPSAKELSRYSQAFRSVRFLCDDFETQLQPCRPGDFVYLDPPYPALNGTSFFVHYSPMRFSSIDQNRVAKEALRLSRLGCRVMISNAGLPWIRDLYKKFRIEVIPTTRFVAAGGIRHRVEDIIALNYDTQGQLLCI